MKRALGWAMVWALVLALGACASGGGGAGGDGSAEETTEDTSKEDAANLVAEGKAILEATLSDFLADTTQPVPFAGLADAADRFIQAAPLDPDNAEAQLYGGVFRVIAFLDSDSAVAFLGKMGWPELREEGVPEDFLGDFSDALGATPPVNIGDFGIPYGPLATELHVGGVDEIVDLTLEELLAFLTKEFPDALGEAVLWLERVPTDFHSTLTFTLPEEQPRAPALGETFTLELDYSDAKAAQSVLATVRAGLLVASIWKFPGLDPFLESQRTVDPEDEAQLIYSFDVDDTDAYFKNGMPGVAGVPFSGNPHGRDALKSSIQSATLGVEDFLTGILAESDDQSDDLLQRDIVFEVFNDSAGDYEYDDKMTVVEYFLEPIKAVAEDIRNSAVSGSASIRAYQTAAFITDFEQCDPVFGVVTNESADTDTNGSLDETNTDNFSSTADAITPVSVDASSSERDISPAYVFDPGMGEGSLQTQFTLSVGSARNFSIFTRGGTGANIQVAYNLDGALVIWDGDDGTLDVRDAGVSIDGDSFGNGLPDAPATLYIQVHWSSANLYELYVLAGDDYDPDQATGGWPSTIAPIFLKGNGRHFEAHVYRHATANLSIGKLIDTLSSFFDQSDRASFDLSLVYNPDTGKDETEAYLEYRKDRLCSSITGVFPTVSITDFAGSDLDPCDTSELDIFAPPAIPELTVFGIEETADVSDDDFGGVLSFCAYPRALSRSLLFEGGYSAVNLF